MTAVMVRALMTAVIVVSDGDSHHGVRCAERPVRGRRSTDPEDADVTGGDG